MMEDREDCPATAGHCIIAFAAEITPFGVVLKFTFVIAAATALFRSSWALAAS